MLKILSEESFKGRHRKSSLQNYLKVTFLIQWEKKILTFLLKKNSGENGIFYNAYSNRMRFPPLFLQSDLIIIEELCYHLVDWNTGFLSCSPLYFPFALTLTTVQDALLL